MDIHSIIKTSLFQQSCILAELFKPLKIYRRVWICAVDIINTAWYMMKTLIRRLKMLSMDSTTISFSASIRCMMRQMLLPSDIISKPISLIQHKWIEDITEKI